MAMRAVRLWRLSGSSGNASWPIFRSCGSSVRSKVPGSLLSTRSFASAVSQTAKPRRLRKLFGVLCTGAAGAGAWKMNETVTPADAESLAFEHEEHRKAEIERIGKKLSRWRLLELIWLLVPVMFASPLWIIAPGLFWKVVALQIDRSGPCFIKLAQWMSTRRDIFSDELCECLSVMHESVEAAWSAPVTAKDITEKLKNSPLTLTQIDDAAVASGSIAEVYFGEISDGTQVAVKCLRPGACELLEGDLAWMLHVGLVASKNPNFEMLGLRRAAEDFCEHVQMQVNFEIEAANLRRFKTNFANSGELVRFPTPLYSSPEILVLTRERGDNLATIFRSADDVSVKRSQKAGFWQWLGMGKSQGSKKQEVKAKFVTEQEMNMLQDRSSDIQTALSVPARTTRKIGQEVLCSYMRMVFNDAFIHGDLHPGNMMIRLNEGAYDNGKEGGARDTQVGGWQAQVLKLLPASIRNVVSPPSEPPFELVLLDAGLAIPLAPKRVEALRSMAISLLYCDFRGSATHIYNQSPDSSKCKDPEAFKTELGNVFSNVRKSVSEVGYVQVSDACLECLRLVRVHQVQLDTGMTWALFAMLSAEGCAKQLDPEADCTGAAARYIVTVPSLLREMHNQPPEILWKMVREIVVGRKTHKAKALAE